MVMVWDMGTNKVVQMTDIEFMNNNVVRIIIDNDNYPGNVNKQLAVRIANGGVERHP